jgi:cytochrome c peroxidase
MHTGAIANLWDVMKFYNDAGGSSAVGKRAPASQVPLGLSDQELAELVEFLRTLDGDPLPTALVSPPALP